ncbi:XRE family transcriptional regulator [Erysipelotrichaceae bacterium OttesenSCG-928-M19]|nr:XRE family transcriptional regulator [Erysipelotrichaceae bacterium OttesenSCG-928-M19]
MIENNFINQILYYENLSASELATIIDVNKSTIHRWINGDIENIKMDKLLDLATKLDVNPIWMMGKSDVYRFSDYQKNKTSRIFDKPVAIAGSGSCGLGDLNEGVITEWQDTPMQWLNGNPDEYFWAIANGDSMIGSGIIDGSMLLFKMQKNLNNGDIGAFHLNGEDYIKKFEKKGNTILLISTNLDYDPIIVTKDDDFRIIAKLIKQVTDF